MYWIFCLPLLMLLHGDPTYRVWAAGSAPDMAMTSFSSDCDSIPGLNQRILEFVSAHIRKKVGRGECWDLAAEALNTHKAKWNGRYAYGREIQYQQECVFPGDMIQFEGVQFSYRIDNRIVTETMAHHTAVVYAVKGTGIFTIAHQNTSFSGKKVGLSDLDLSTIKRGRFKIYRPVSSSSAGR